MPNTRGATSGPALTGITAALTAGGIGLALSGTYAVTGFGVPCPWRYLTHTLCPFCGATTMGADLLRGDFAAAWSANQFVFLILAGVLVASVFWGVRLLGGPSVRLPRGWADQRRWYGVLGAAALAFAVVRNLVPLG